MRRTFSSRSDLMCAHMHAQVGLNIDHPLFKQLESRVRYVSFISPSMGRVLVVIMRQLLVSYISL